MLNQTKNICFFCLVVGVLTVFADLDSDWSDGVVILKKNKNVYGRIKESEDGGGVRVM